MTVFDVDMRAFLRRLLVLLAAAVRRVRSHYAVRPVVVFPGALGTVERAVVLSAVASTATRASLAQCEDEDRPTVWTDVGACRGCVSVCRFVARDVLPRDAHALSQVDASFEALTEFLTTVRTGDGVHVRAALEGVDDRILCRHPLTVRCWTTALAHVAAEHPSGFENHPRLAAWLRANVATDSDSDSDEEQSDDEEQEGDDEREGDEECDGDEKRDDGARGDEERESKKDM